MKRLRILLTLIVVTISIITSSSLSAYCLSDYSQQIGDYFVGFTDDNAQIISYDGPGGAVSLPSQFNGYPLEIIYEDAFIDQPDITSITIPPSVISLTDFDQDFFDFRNCFEGCSNLEEIIVAQGNEKYSSFKGVLFNSERTELLKCPKGKSGSYNIPDGVTKVYWNSFENCNRLTSVFIPKSLVFNTFTCNFNGCSSMTEFVVDSGNKDYSSYNGILYDKEKKILIYCPEAKSGKLVIPEGVSEIGGLDIGNAFKNCTQLNEIVLPDSVTTFKGNAFFNCIGLTSITIPRKVKTIENETFRNCSNLKEVILPSKLTTIKDYAFYGCSQLTSITIPKKVNSISDTAFLDCDRLTILCEKGSYAEEYSLKNGISISTVETNTSIVIILLLIGLVLIVSGIAAFFYIRTKKMMADQNNIKTQPINTGNE